MALPGLWNKLTAGIFGAGIGIASADALTPLLEPAKQRAWQENQHRVLALGLVGELVAQGLLEHGDAADEAGRQGFDASRMRATAEALLSAPGVGQLLELWRREEIDAVQFTHGLRKMKLEPEWDKPIEALRDVLLSAQDLAVMVQRGIVANDGLLPVGPPAGRGKVPPMPAISVDPIKEAGKQGWTADRLAGLARIIGLPAAPDLAARMTFRGIIDRVDFDRAVSEGNTRNEWAPFLFEGFREILTAHDYAELQLRGYLTKDERLLGTAKHGMSERDSELLYDMLGRSIPVHQITTGLARGGSFGGDGSDVPEVYRQSLQRGNLRPEYYDLAYANRYSLPGVFVLRAMAQAGDLDEARVEQLLLWTGWPPSLAKQVAAAWADKAKASAAKHKATAQTSLYAAQHHSFVTGHTGPAEAEQTLMQLAVPADAVPGILELWQREREITPPPRRTSPLPAPPPAP